VAAFREELDAEFSGRWASATRGAPLGPTAAQRPAYVRAVSYETVLYDVRDGVATVTLNRPDELNAWTTRLGAELGDAMA
jgi:hypothetical protein